MSARVSGDARAQADALVGAVTVMAMIVDRIEFAGEFTLREAAVRLQTALQERADVRWMNVEEQMR